MAVVFQPDKDAANVAKHGVSLSLAEAFDLRRADVIADERRDYGEKRWIAYDRIGGRLYVLIFTMREGDVRVISLRKANRREVKRHG